jgi:hypothetical protein
MHIREPGKVRWEYTPFEKNPGMDLYFLKESQEQDVTPMRPLVPAAISDLIQDT